MRTICRALQAHHGNNANAFADQQMGIATGEALAIWLAILRWLRA